MIKFSDLKLDPKVLKAIEDAGYETPTPIQAGAIPPALEGRDVLGIAQTGTGKTASFTLPMITLLAKGRARARMPRSLVLCPTRELAAQVAENFDTYTKYHKLTKALLIGGVSFKEQDQLIDRGVDVLIATPGRLLDHFERGKLLLTGVQIMVVDEADRMLDMGFIPDIERIFSLTPFTRQTLFFSATMAPEIERITNTFLSAPERVEVARQASASATITQGVVMFKASRKDQEASEKRQLLRKLIDNEGEKCRNAIIFCNRKTDVDIVAKSLVKYGYDAAPIHGDLEQSQRTRTLDGFRDGTLRFLVASDVAARGLDIPNVSHVFNFDVPSHAEDYVHRIGRTGRAGRLGTTIMICTPRDDKNFADVERLLQTEIPRLANPLDGVIIPASEEEGEGGAATRSRSSASRSRSSRSRTGEKPAGDRPAAGKPAGGKAATVQAAPAEEALAEEAPAPAVRARIAPVRIVRGRIVRVRTVRGRIAAARGVRTIAAMTGGIGIGPAAVRGARAIATRAATTGQRSWAWATICPVSSP
jgi:superfamily II DNA/RNA helicase